MRRVATFFATTGLLMCLASILTLLQTPATLAQSLPERPTVTPVPSTEERDDTNDQPAAQGRITGTVIESTSGAPAAGITVTVGDVDVITDANGNYDRSGLPAGTYTVTLRIAPERGVPDQGSIGVVLADGATVVQHLRYHSAAMPQAPATQPAPAPSQLPNTGGEQPTQPLLLTGLLLLAASLIIRRAATRST